MAAVVRVATPSIGISSASLSPLQRSGLLSLIDHSRRQSRRERHCSLQPLAASAASGEVSDGRGGGEEEVGGETAALRLQPVRRLVQQKRRAQWSRGDGPGEYGGPPLDTKIRKTWGGGPVVDPLTDSSDYIWKKNWQSFLDAESSDTVARLIPKGKEADSGFLSLNRSIALDSMDVDLSKELMMPSKATLQRQVEEARRLDAAVTQKSQATGPKWRLAPTRREEEYWAKGRKAATGGSEVMAREVSKAQIDPVMAAERQRQWYLELKRNLLLLTFAIGGLGTTTCYLAYSAEIAASYGAGLIGALVYIRMLGNSVDGLGQSFGQGAARQALGAPRLLVPVILVMVYSRWNALIVPEYDVMRLDLIPMLLGFFTYKAATLVETFKELLPTKEGKSTS